MTELEEFLMEKIIRKIDPNAIIDEPAPPPEPEKPADEKPESDQA